MTDLNQIREHMEVIGADGAHVLSTRSRGTGSS